MRAFLQDFRANWNDSYWWLDHQALRVALLTIISGLVGLIFLWAQLELKARYEPAGEGVPDG